MRTMKRPYQFTGTVFLLFSAYVAWESWNGLRFYTSLGPGPGFFPFWLSMIMGVLSLIMLFQATFRQPEPMPEDFFASRVGYIRALSVCIAILGVVFLMNTLGFRLTMLLFYFFLLFSLGRRVNPIIMVMVALVGSWGAFWLFNEVLKVPLPQGTLGF